MEGGLGLITINMDERKPHSSVSVKEFRGKAHNKDTITRT